MEVVISRRGNSGNLGVWLTNLNNTGTSDWNKVRGVIYDLLNDANGYAKEGVGIM